MTRIVAALASALVLVGSNPGARAGADELLYHVEDGRVVFTNVPRSDAKPVPGFTVPRRADPDGLPATPYDPFIDVVARENGLSPGLIKAVALVESGFDARAVSPKGARGLMQLMPATAAMYNVSDVFDPLQNLRAGAEHLRRLLDEFEGDLTLALAAYNAGSGAVRRHGGVPDYRETRAYVDRVKRRIGAGASSSGQVERPVEVAPVKLMLGADGSVLLVN